MNEGNWRYSPDHGQLCKVIKTRVPLGRDGLPRGVAGALTQDVLACAPITLVIPFSRRIRALSCGVWVWSQADGEWS